MHIHIFRMAYGVCTHDSGTILQVIFK